MAIEAEIKISGEKISDENYCLQRLFHQFPEAKNAEKVALLKRSLDARNRPAQFILRYFIGSEAEWRERLPARFQMAECPSGKKVAVIGFGPAGIYAAFSLLEAGHQVLDIERGKKVRERRRDLAALNKSLVVDPESNYCFGEGGAGTYSDGKLYTRSKKRGDIQKVLQSFVDHGASPNILVEAHPHIGTNKLPGIIENLREELIRRGAEILFESKLTDFRLENEKIRSLIVNDTQEIPIDAVILATGHSARDIFHLLDKRKIEIEAKPFALGVRIEHPQELIDQLRYGYQKRPDYLPPASYSLVTQASGNGVFSFCMCPGGIIAPAATDSGEVVVNGWSPSKRNGHFANSGMVVTVNPEHWKNQFGDTALSALSFQQRVEQLAFDSTGSIKAPAQRVDDFIRKRTSSGLPECSYLPGIESRNLHEILPGFIAKSLSEGLQFFDKKMKGFAGSNGILTGVESRTSSPVRIPRNKDNFQHIRISNLYPCGEGAGYAGGIISAALDGIACANAYSQSSI